MKNDPRSNVYHWPIALCLALFAAVFAAPVMAEVGLPPPVQHQNAGFPSDQALQRRGYDPKTGVWKTDVQNNGKPTVKKDGATYNGSQNKTVTVTGKYGETGTMNTTVNQRVGTGRLQTAANTVIVANAVNNSYTKNYASEAANAFKNGNYLQAAHNSIMTLGAALDGILGGAIRDIATGIGNGLKEPQQYEQAQRQAEAEGNYQKAVAQAAAKKAAEAAQKAKQQDQQKKEEQQKDEEAKKKGLFKYQLIVEVDGSYKNYVYYAQDGYTLSGSAVNTLNNSAAYLRRFVSSYNIDLGKAATPSEIKVSTPSDKLVFVRWKSYKEGTVPESEKEKLGQNQSQIKPEDFMLTQKEILDILKRMLENNQTNHAELMNQLAKMGVMNQSAEPSTFSPDTALSAPYTPEGSSTPQQTRFRMNQDGTVGVDYVPRPDLKPNSPEAPNKPEKTTPSRQESPDTPNAPNSPNSPNTPNEPNSQNKQNQNDKEKDFCQKNPNSDQCILGGKSEDIKLPEQTIDLNFKPENIFQTDGVCPQPQSVDLGAFGRVEFSYQPLCDFAAKLRPVLIMMTILTCAWFVYGALQDL